MMGKRLKNIKMMQQTLARRKERMHGIVTCGARPMGIFGAQVLGDECANSSAPSYTLAGQRCTRMHALQ